VVIAKAGETSIQSEKKILSLERLPGFEEIHSIPPSRPVVIAKVGETSIQSEKKILSLERLPGFEEIHSIPPSRPVVIAKVRETSIRSVTIREIPCENDRWLLWCN
jgi:hypothetical protein